MNGIHQDPVTNEWFYPADGYILSETNSDGIILYVNELFCDVAGYSKEELIGEPHNIVRHPDMPAVAFKGLWDDLQNKGFWTGFVKNRRKDNGYYWVYATALRKEHPDGTVTYLSIRIKPQRSNVDACTKLYAELKVQE